MNEGCLNTKVTRLGGIKAFVTNVAKMACVTVTEAIAHPAVVVSMICDLAKIVENYFFAADGIFLLKNGENFVLQKDK